MSTYEIIQIAGIIISAFTSIVAIVISVKTLCQNSKMIEESTRPYITVYTNTTYFGEPTLYLVIKNFGSTSATISNFYCDTNLEEYSYLETIKPFSDINGLNLAPNQKISYPIKTRNESNELIKNIKISFDYSDKFKVYSENKVINLSEYYNSADLRIYNENEPFKSVAYSIEDISEKML